MPRINEKLSPVVHQTNSDLVRLPMRKVDNHYTAYVADGYQRNFDENTLPDLLKSKFAMILASPDVPLSYDYELQVIGLYVNTMSPEMNDIGWRASDTYFCLIVTREFLESLKGG